jgi:hypothetical protein
MSDEPEPQCEDEERIQRLVTKIDSWLATVDIGGDTYREFDSSHLACFALENSLDDLPSEEIYKLFVDLAVQPEVRSSLSPFHHRHVLHVPRPFLLPPSCVHRWSTPLRRPKTMRR